MLVSGEAYLREAPTSPTPRCAWDPFLTPRSRAEEDVKDRTADQAAFAAGTCRRSFRPWRPCRAAASAPRTASRTLFAKSSHSATNFLMPTWSIRLIAPPVCGAKPRPMIEPTSPSCGLVSTLLSRQRAVSTSLHVQKTLLDLLLLGPLVLALAVEQRRIGREVVLQLRPQALLAVGRILVEALAVLAAEALQLLHHQFEDVPRCRCPRTSGRRLGVAPRLVHDLPRQVDGDLVVERQRTDRHAGITRAVLDHRRGHAFLQHRWPSLMKAPQTREVKKPRLSLTTIGVLRIFWTKSSARASVSCDSSGRR